MSLLQTEIHRQTSWWVGSSTQTVRAQGSWTCTKRLMRGTGTSAVTLSLKSLAKAGKTHPPTLLAVPRWTASKPVPNSVSLDRPAARPPTPPVPTQVSSPTPPTPVTQQTCSPPSSGLRCRSWSRTLNSNTRCHWGWFTNCWRGFHWICRRTGRD